MTKTNLFPLRGISTHKMHKASTLVGVFLAGQLLGAFAGRHGVNVSQLRILGLVAVLSEAGQIVGSANVTEILGRSDGADIRRDLLRLGRLGLLERQKRGKASGWRVTLAGARVLGLLEREERALRRKVREYGAGLKLWARPYAKGAKWYLSRGLPVPPGV